MSTERAAKYNKAEMHAGRLTGWHLSHLVVEVGGDLEAAVRKFEIEQGLSKDDGYAGPEVRARIEKLWMKRIVPVAKWRGRDAEISRGWHDGPSSVGGLHKGLDLMFLLRPGEKKIVTEAGVPIYKGRAGGWVFPTFVIAAAEGVVAHIVHISNGWWVTIDHPDGWRSQYGHLAKPIVKEGQKVVAGDKIADPDPRMYHPTAGHWPPHLHFGLGYTRSWPMYVDPKPWLFRD